MANLTFNGEQKQATTIFFLSLNLSAVLKKSTLGKFAYIRHFQGIGINATVFDKTRIHYKSDRFRCRLRRRC